MILSLERLLGTYGFSVTVAHFSSARQAGHFCSAVYRANTKKILKNRINLVGIYGFLLYNLYMIILVAIIFSFICSVILLMWFISYVRVTEQLKREIDQANKDMYGELVFTPKRTTNRKNERKK